MTLKIASALHGVTLLGIDTAPIIYLVEKHPVYFARMAEILRYINNGSVGAVSSILTLTEVLTQPLRQGKIALIKDYEDILQNSTGFDLFDLTSTIARNAAALRARYNLKTPDAIQIATCIETRCQALLTNDLSFKRITELQILVLDELEI